MGIGFYLSIGMLPVMIILSIIFFTKEKINNVETKIYSYILIVSIFMTIFEILSALLFKSYFGSLIYNLIAKLVLINYILAFFLFCHYIMNICNCEKKKINILYIGTFLVLIIVLFTNTTYTKVGDGIVPKGVPVILTYAYSLIVGIYEIFLTITNKNKIIMKKFTPLYSFIILGIINTLIIYIYPTSFMVGYIICLVIIIMNFTIENPDVKLAKELAFQKQVAESSSNKTLELLDSMSNDLKSSLQKLETLGNKEINNENVDELKREIADFKKNSVKLSNRILGIIDLAAIKGTLEIKESKYETKEMIKKLDNSLTKDLNKNNLLINENNNMPSELYGDEDNLIKLVLHFSNYIGSIIGNDNVSLILSSMQVGRFSRLKFRYITSNKNVMKAIHQNRAINRLEFIPNNDINYQIVNNLMERMNGKITINVEEKNIVIELSVDQRLLSEFEIISNKEENKNVEIIYSNFNGKRILIVDNNNSEVKELKTLLRPYSIDVSSANSEAQMNDILKRNETFDLIFIDSAIPKFEISEYSNEIVKSKESILNNIELNAKYPIPAVIILNSNVKNMEQEFLNYGFDDCIIKPITKENLDIVINKYFNKD